MATPSLTKHEFRGTILVQSVRFFLESGGIRVEVIPADAQTGAALQNLNGVTTRILGEQQEARIVDAQIAPQMESAPAATSDPALAALLPLARNPPDALKNAIAAAGEKSWESVQDTNW